MLRANNTNARLTCHLGSCSVVVCMKTSWNLPDIYSKNKHKIKQRTFRGSCPEVLLKNWKSSLENMCARVTFLNKAADLVPAIALKERHRHMYFSVNFENFLRKNIWKNIWERLLLKIANFSFLHRFVLFEIQSCHKQMVRAWNKRAVHDKWRKMFLKGKPSKLFLGST